MAETTMRSPGVSVYELDLSAPGTVQPQGIPAGVIGTAQKGPAFVPRTFATSQEFKNLFGDTEGKHFGAMAVNEWMRNAQSGLYCRVLGIGDGKKANDKGDTTNAGFLVGEQISNQSSTEFESADSALVPDVNPFANTSIVPNIQDGAIEDLSLSILQNPVDKYIEIHDVENDIKGVIYVYDGSGTNSGSLLNDGNDNITFEVEGVTGPTFNAADGYRAFGLVSATSAIGATSKIAAMFGTIKGENSPVAPGSSASGAANDDIKLVFDETIFTNNTLTQPGAVAALNLVSSAEGVGDFNFNSATIFNTDSGDITVTVNTAGVVEIPGEGDYLDGSVYFLGCEMTSPSSSQDYLDSTKNILRGTLMSPNGIVISLDGGTVAFDGDTAATNASPAGDLANGGSNSGLLLEDNFVIILNGFNNSDYASEILCSMNPTSPIYFKKVLNTDPSKLQERGHYLYSHLDVPSGLATPVNGANKVFLGLGKIKSLTQSADTYTPYFENWEQKFENAFTPWISSQDLGNGAKKLFRFHMFDAGVGGHNNIKVSIDGITKSTDLAYEYGTFNVKIREASDLDSKPVVLQTFSNVTLDPSSERYIGRVIGDSNLYFDFEAAQGKQKLRLEGLYPNRSQYVRVEVVDEVEAGTMEPSALPVGFAGKHHLVLDGAAVDGTPMFEPPLPFRQNLATGVDATKEVDPSFHWGVQNQDVRSVSQRNASQSVSSLVANLTKFYPTIGDNPAWIGDNAGALASASGEVQDANVYNDNAFSLEKIWVKTKTDSDGLVDLSLPVDPRQWHEAAYIRDGSTGAALEAYENQQDGTKLKTAANGWRFLDIAKDFGESASKRYFKFTVPFQGGFDGLDIFDREKSAMSNLSSWREMNVNASPVLGGPDGPTTAAFRKAIDILSETTDVDIQLLAIPGMSAEGITDYAIDKTEERFDALFVMDLQAHDHENNIVTTSTQETSVTNTAQALSNRNLDTSFAATYFPDVVIQDGNFAVSVPSSVAVLGALSLNDSLAHPWYAPAGFTRGSLPTTIETSVKLNRANMDVLYESDINPITSFPQQGEGVVVFGQKTLLQAQSSLDRVNVRRLLIDIRRKVRSVANTILFEPNRESTLAKFSSLVNPILNKIQAQQGLDKFKVVIDTTTTTQQDVENNTIRGKIFLQPTKSIEFISLDFVVTNAGAEI